MVMSFGVFLLRLPPSISLRILQYRLLVDAVAFLGTFLLLGAFSNSFVALLTSGFMGLITTGFLEMNHHTRVMERLMLWTCRRKMTDAELAIHRAQTTKDKVRYTKELHSLERQELRLRKRLDGPKR